MGQRHGEIPGKVTSLADCNRKRRPNPFDGIPREAIGKKLRRPPVGCRQILPDQMGADALRNLHARVFVHTGHHLLGVEFVHLRHSGNLLFVLMF